MDEHVMFRDSLRKFLQKEAVPHYDTWEKDRLIPIAFWKKLGEMGFLCPQVDEKYGGLGLDFSFSVIIGEELERVGTGLTGVGLHNDIVVPYIESFGTMEQKARWLPGCVSADNITAIAVILYRLLKEACTMLPIFLSSMYVMYKPKPRITSLHKGITCCTAGIVADI